MNDQVPGTTTQERILVFIPCYNCAPQIGRVLRQLDDKVAAHVDEVLVLDNGSRDGTVETAMDAGKQVPIPVKVARNRDNYNLGGSHKAAYAYALQNGFTHVVTLHGDDQGDILDLIPILQRGLHREYDACLGSRFMRGARLINYSPFRIIGNHVFNRIFALAARHPVSDLGSGLNILARSAFADKRLQRLPDDLRFNAFQLLDLIDAGRAIHFFPISWREDDQVSNVRMASQALRTLQAPLLFRGSREAFRERDLRSVRRTSYAFDATN